MSFGFSVGDCLTAILFIKEVVASLSKSYGSAAEFQELVRELTNLQHTLGVIEHLHGNEDSRDSIEAIKRTAADCQAVLDKYGKKLDRYRGSLAMGMSDGKVKDAVKKVRWTLSMKQDVQNFRAYVTQYMATVNAQLGLENLNTAAITSENRRNDHKSVEASVEMLHHRVASQSATIQGTESSVNDVNKIVYRQLAPQTQYIAESMESILEHNMQMLGLVTKLQSSHATVDLRHTWFQPPIKFEDATGDVIPFARECDLHDLKSLIRSRFEPRRGRRSKPGFDKVLAEEYELFDSDNNAVQITEDQLDTIADCSGITMAFIIGQFAVSPFKLDSCPKPGCRSTRLSQPYAGGKVCLDCKTWFDKAAKGLPRPYRPSDLDKVNPIPLHRSQLYSSKWKKRSIDDKASTLPHQKLQILESERKSFKNIRIVATELQKTPTTSNIRTRRRRPKAEMRSHIIAPLKKQPPSSVALNKLNAPNSLLNKATSQFHSISGATYNKANFGSENLARIPHPSSRSRPSLCSLGGRLIQYSDSNYRSASQKQASRDEYTPVSNMIDTLHLNAISQNSLEEQFPLERSPSAWSLTSTIVSQRSRKVPVMSDLPLSDGLHQYFRSNAQLHDAVESFCPTCQEALSSSNTYNLMEHFEMKHWVYRMWIIVNLLPDEEKLDQCENCVNRTLYSNKGDAEWHLLSHKDLMDDDLLESIALSHNSRHLKSVADSQEILKKQKRYRIANVYARKGEDDMLIPFAKCQLSLNSGEYPAKKAHQCMCDPSPPLRRLCVSHMTPKHHFSHIFSTQATLGKTPLSAVKVFVCFGDRCGFECPEARQLLEHAMTHRIHDMREQNARQHFRYWIK